MNANVFSGINNGAVQVTASYSGVTSSSNVTVQAPQISDVKGDYTGLIYQNEATGNEYYIYFNILSDFSITGLIMPRNCHYLSVDHPNMCEDRRMNVVFSGNLVFNKFNIILSAGTITGKCSVEEIGGQNKSICRGNFQNLGNNDIASEFDYHYMCGTTNDLFGTDCDADGTLTAVRINSNNNKAIIFFTFTLYLNPYHF